VLIVDDEPGLLLLFGRLVEKLGHDAIQVESGALALEVLERETPDLLILDLAMPTISGADVLRRIRGMPRLANMRVMVLTATGPGPAPADVEDQIDSWVMKPASLTAFSDTIRELLEDDH
jgi:CheY-like chemotaxis protein